jgi:riboflavin kinase/FMN adenylyltransferase
MKNGFPYEPSLFTDEMMIEMSEKNGFDVGPPRDKTSVKRIDSNYKDYIPARNKKASVTIGNFDGLHRGHQALIRRIVSYNPDYVPVVITFKRRYKRGEKPAFIFKTLDDKIYALRNLGVKVIMEIEFTKKFRRTKGIEFLETLLEYGNVGFFAAGKNFRCGYQLDTDVTAIQKFFASRNIPVEIIDEVMEGSLPISSSRIREAIAKGDMELASSMLL